MRALLALAAILVSLLLVEGVLRLYFAVRTNYDIEMWQYAVALKQSVSDRRSHVHAPGRSAHLMNVDIQINSKGLRDREFEYEKPPGTYRILALGASVTLGWGVPVDETFAKRLERQLNDDPELKRQLGQIEVLNMGVGNYTTEQEVEAYLLEGRKYHPDAVILFHHMNDAEPVQKNANNAFTAHSYLYAFIIQRMSQLRPYLDPSRHYVSYYRSLYQGEAFKSYSVKLDELVDAVTKDKVRFLAVLLPEIRSLETYPFEGYHDVMRDYFTARGVTAIDTLPLFNGKRSLDFAVAWDDPHLNSKGHAIVADLVARELKQRSLLQ